MKIVVSAVITFGAMVALLACTSGKKPVTFDELPQPLQTLVTQHFSAADIAYATVERDDMAKKYVLVMSDGTGIEADNKGRWYEIESGHGNTVPAGLIPQQITSYLSAKHPGSEVMKIENKKNGWEVKLTGGVEIKFNNNFVVTEYDH